MSSVSASESRETRTIDRLESKIEEANEIAARCLRRCYGKDGIYAGSRHFRNYWARDAFYAILGALEIGDTDVAKKTLELFMRFSKEDYGGKIVPLRIGDPNIILSFLGFHFNSMVPRYTQDKGHNHAYDPNPLMIIAFDEYYKKTKDKSFLEKNRKTLENIIYWCVSRIDKRFNLVESGKYATWQDSIKKKGFTLYNNVLICEAARRAGNLLDDRELENISGLMKESINEHLWNGLFYDDFFKVNTDKENRHSKRRYSIFATFENTLAIEYGIADNVKAHSIERYIMHSDINDVIPSLTNYQRYPPHELSRRMHLVGMGDYHNHSMAWLFIGLSDAMAKYRIGFRKEARDELGKIAEVITRDNTVYECYETTGTNKGKHVERLLYRSEEDFAISSSYFVRAYDMIIGGNDTGHDSHNTYKHRNR